MNGESRGRITKALGLMAIGVALLMCLLRSTERFSYLVELPLYDQVTQATWPWKTGHEDVVLVTIQSPEDWPLSDGKLAEVLGQISKAKPKVIAVDLVRDSYRSGGVLDARRDAEALDDALGWGHNLLMAEGLPGQVHGGFGAHPYFQKFGEGYLIERVGLANFPRDQLLGFKIRRGLFKTSSPNRFSLAALAAIHASGITDEEVFDRVTDFGATTGGYAISEAEFGNQFLLKFGPDLDSVFPEFSMAEVLAMGRVELEGRLGGKVVFFGTGSTETAKDELPVIGNPEFRGVNLHALACAQLLREMEDGEAPIRVCSDGWEIFLIVVFGLIASIVLWGFQRDGVLRTVWLGVLVLGGLLVEVVALKSGVWVAMGGPIVGVMVMGSTGSIYLHRQTTFALRAHSATLSQQFGESVALLIEQHQEQLLRCGTLPSRQFAGTAFFSDLLGYTGTTERFTLRGEEEKFLEWINNYVSAMVPVIRRNGGVIVKFAGDGIFVVFGFSGEDDHAERALRCGIEMGEALDQLNEGRPVGTEPYLVRVGFYAGPIFAGAVGSRERLSYDFLGSTVNKAARLEGLEKELYHPTVKVPVRILMNEVAFERLASKEDLAPLGKGKWKLDERVDELEEVWMVRRIDLD